MHTIKCLIQSTIRTVVHFEFGCQNWAIYKQMSHCQAATRRSRAVWTILPEAGTCRNQKISALQPVTEQDFDDSVPLLPEGYQQEISVSGPPVSKRIFAVPTVSRCDFYSIVKDVGWTPTEHQKHVARKIDDRYKYRHTTKCLEHWNG